jgi:hypothetical protein
MSRLCTLLVAVTLGLSAPAANALEPGTPLAVSGAGATHGTAHMLEDSDWEVGVWAALRRGLANKMELSIHPLVALQSPHLTLKKGWVYGGDWTISSQHGLHYPTPLLSTFARPGIGGVLPADNTIPHIVASDNRVLASRSFGEPGEGMTVTASARILLAASFGESDWATIDMPIAYARTAAYHNGLATAAGVQLDGGLFGTLDYRLALEGWFLPGADGNWAVEARGFLPWRVSDGFTAQVNATATAGAYPYGTNWHLLPGFDLIWAF